MSEQKQWDNTNRGVVFKNKKKSTEKHPDYTGSVNAKGTDFWVSMWVKESKKDGSKFFSVSLTEKKPVYGEGQKLPEKKEEEKPFEPINDDIPFR